MDNSVIFIMGVITSILFLIGFGHTIKEFREMEDERKTNSFPEESNAEVID